MPNIAITCRTAVHCKGRKRLVANVINLIGFGFDSKQQPDRQFFSDIYSDDEALVEGAVQALKEAYARMWKLAFEAVSRSDQLTTLAVFSVGSAAFSPWGALNEEYFRELIETPVLEVLADKYSDVRITHPQFLIPGGLFDEEDDDLEQTLSVRPREHMLAHALTCSPSQPHTRARTHTHTHTSRLAAPFPPCSQSCRTPAAAATTTHTAALFLVVPGINRCIAFLSSHADRSAPQLRHVRRGHVLAHHVRHTRHATL